MPFNTQTIRTDLKRLGIIGAEQWPNEIVKALCKEGAAVMVHSTDVSELKAADPKSEVAQLTFNRALSPDECVAFSAFLEQMTGTAAMPVTGYRAISDESAPGWPKKMKDGVVKPVDKTAHREVLSDVTTVSITKEMAENLAKHRLIRSARVMDGAGQGAASATR